MWEQLRTYEARGQLLAVHCSCIAPPTPSSLPGTLPSPQLLSHAASVMVFLTLVLLLISLFSSTLCFRCTPCTVFTQLGQFTNVHMDDTHHN